MEERKLASTPTPDRDPKGHPSDLRWLAISRLAEKQGVHPVTSLDDLLLDVWESDAELDALLAELRTSRSANLA
jgi:hypothetical protein